MKANLYKCFLPQGWMIGNLYGFCAFLHPDGIYDDPNGGKFREHVYCRLRFHFQFQNQKKLFSEVGNTRSFSINVYRVEPSNINFLSVANLFSPKTIDMCFNDDGQGVTPGVKNECNEWNIKGHQNRIIDVSENELMVFASLYDEKGVKARHARLPSVHSKEILKVLVKLATHTQRMIHIREKFYPTQHWNEVFSQNDGTIIRDTKFPESRSNLILSGPHFFSANPFFKTPRSKCASHRDYDLIDLTFIPNEYLPRSNYAPRCNSSEYNNRTPKVPWNKKPTTQFYRLVSRAMVDPIGERTLICSIIPPSVAHINGVQSITFDNTDDLIFAGFFMTSIIADFYIKSTGRTNLHHSWENLPLFTVNKSAIIRILTLVCLSKDYADLWKQLWCEREHYQFVNKVIAFISAN